MSVELIIFDLDGTLIDSSPDIASAINHSLQPYGLAPMTIEETRELVGEGVTRLIEKVIDRKRVSFPSGSGEPDKTVLLANFLDHYAAHLTDRTTVYPGVTETLERLSGYRKAVISNKREDLSVAVLRQLGLLPYFDLVLGSDTTPERKPSPVPVQFVLARIGVSARRAVIVGDSDYDIKAGKATGVTTVGVTYGYRSVDFLRGADFIITAMPELIDVLRVI
jgi:phosphoglycolate phosphatase